MKIMFLNTDLRILLLGFLLIVQQGASLQSQDMGSRVWTNQQGRTVKAAFVEMSGLNVVIQLENGSRSSVPLGTLSKADQEYVQKLQAGGAAASSGGQGTATGNLVWPQEVISVDPKSIVVTEGLQDEKARQYHYKTGSFEFIAYAPLAGTVMSEVASDFELVRTAFSRMPWGWEPKPKTGGMFQIYLTETPEDYIAMGGDDRSASASPNGKSLIRFTTLGLKKVGARYQYDARQREPGEVSVIVARTLLYEYRLLFYPWSMKGLEQFTRNIAYQNNGTIKYTDPVSALKKEIKAMEVKTKAVPKLARMLKYMREGYLDRRPGDVLQILYENQLDAELLLYFFGYLDGDGSGAGWHKYCRGIFQEPPAERNTANYERALKLLEELIGGRDDAKLGAEMTEKFKAIGVKLAP